MHGEEEKKNNLSVKVLTDFYLVCFVFLYILRRNAKTTGNKMASDSPRRPSRCAGGVLVRAQAAT